MNYLVIELQTNNGETSNISYAYSNKAEAESKYHQILSSAAISNVETHAAIMIDECGSPERCEYYKHEAVND